MIGNFCICISVSTKGLHLYLSSKPVKAQVLCKTKQKGKNSSDRSSTQTVTHLHTTTVTVKLNLKCNFQISIAEHPGAFINKRPVFCNAKYCCKTSNQFGCSNTTMGLRKYSTILGHHHIKFVQKFKFTQGVFHLFIYWHM